jgi:hypothetical protein
LISFQKENPKVFPPPQKYTRGVLGGLELLPALKPGGFVEEFFNYEKLSEIWDEGMFNSEF